MTIKVLARRNSAHGNTLDTIDIPVSALVGISENDNGFTFISHIPNIPNDIKRVYRMVYIPELQERNRLIKGV